MNSIMKRISRLYPDTMGRDRLCDGTVNFKGKWIPRFAIVTKANGRFTFSTRDNKATLRAVNKYIESNRLVKSLSFFQVVGRGLKRLFRIKTKKK